MKSGIYLGPKVGAARRPMWVLLLVAIAGTIFHATTHVRQRAHIEELRAHVRRHEATMAVGTRRELSETASDALARLGASSQSGVTDVIPPTALLSLLERALPDDVAIVGVSAELSSPTPALLVDAVARREEDVTELQKRVASSRAVTATQLLEERIAPDGTLSVRLQVDLGRGRER